MEADGEIFTGVILSQVGHILVPARVTEAEIIRLKIVDYQPVKVVAVDTESGLGVVQVEGQRHLQPVVLGTVGDLREYAPAPLPNPVDGYLYRSYKGYLRTRPQSTSGISSTCGWSTNRANR